MAATVEPRPMTIVATAVLSIHGSLDQTASLRALLGIGSESVSGVCYIMPEKPCDDALLSQSMAASGPLADHSVPEFVP